MHNVSPGEAETLKVLAWLHDPPSVPDSAWYANAGAGADQGDQKSSRCCKGLFAPRCKLCVRIRYEADAHMIVSFSVYYH